MTDRDRLIELIKNALSAYGTKVNADCKPQDFIADFIVASGVTVGDAKIATTTWRPASEPPKNGNERVAVFLQDDLITAAIGNNRIDTDRYLDGRWVRWGRFVTYWMPLPNPPKEVE